MHKINYLHIRECCHITHTPRQTDIYSSKIIFYANDIISYTMWVSTDILSIICCFLYFFFHLYIGKNLKAKILSINFCFWMNVWGEDKIFKHSDYMFTLSTQTDMHVSFTYTSIRADMSYYAYFLLCECMIHFIHEHFNFMHILICSRWISFLYELPSISLIFFYLYYLFTHTHRISL